MIMAGLLAPFESWGHVWREWNNVLALPEFGISVFHAADCEKASNEFKGWDRQRIDALQTRLLDVLRDPKL